MRRQNKGGQRLWITPTPLLYRGPRLLLVAGPPINPPQSTYYSVTSSVRLVHLPLAIIISVTGISKILLSQHTLLCSALLYSQWVKSTTHTQECPNTTLTYVGVSIPAGCTKAVDLLPWYSHPKSRAFSASLSPR